MKLNILFFIFLSSLFTACSSIPSVDERIVRADELIKNSKIKKEIISTNEFLLYSLQESSNCDTLRVYIEGDGLSWITRTKISNNPTPINPLTIKLFLKDDNTCKVYLARPCQYTDDLKCEKKYWTTHRFSNKVLFSYFEAFDKLKDKYKNKEFEIVGFSGGGAIATLISSKRDDISYLITVAGNLDHKYWTQKNRISPLNGSLNPVDFSKNLTKIKQIHLIGGKDNIIDESIYNSYISYFDDKSNINSIKYEEFSHQKGWEENWDKIIKSIFLF